MLLRMTEPSKRWSSICSQSGWWARTKGALDLSGWSFIDRTVWWPRKRPVLWSNYRFSLIAHARRDFETRSEIRQTRQCLL